MEGPSRKVAPDLGCLDNLARVRLGHIPTPLEAMRNLAKAFPDRRLFVKRDDCTGLALGGNKVRQLEFYLGEAVQQRADTILITGAVQSNFARLAAAAARRMGMVCHVQQEQRVADGDPLYHRSGNVLLEQLLGASLYPYAEGEDEAGADRRLGEIADRLKAAGRRPYVIPLGPGHKPLGALGYVDAAREILRQCQEENLVIDEVVIPSGSGNTHAGLLFGLRALGSPIAVTGICVRRPATAQAGRIADRCGEIAALLGVPAAVKTGDIRLVDDVLAPGYGRLNAATRDAMRTAANAEALILDPVYSGKAMAGFLDRVAQSETGRALMFVHTGGSPTVFAYGDMLRLSEGDAHD